MPQDQIWLALLCYKHNDIQVLRDQLYHNNPLHKTRTILDNLNTKFQNIYTLEECLTTDEAICIFHDCIFFKVYMRGHSIKIFQYVNQNVVRYADYKCTMMHTLQIWSIIHHSMYLIDCVSQQKIKATQYVWTDGF